MDFIPCFLMNQMYFCVVLQLIPRLSGLSWIIGAWQEEWENKDGLKAADSVLARRGKRCLCLSASCNHLLVASDNDFRWRWPHKWRQLLQFFGMPNVLPTTSRGATITLCSDWLT